MTGLAEHCSHDYKEAPAVNGYELAYAIAAFSHHCRRHDLESAVGDYEFGTVQACETDGGDGMMNRWYGPCPWLAVALFVHIGVLEFNQT